MNYKIVKKNITGLKSLDVLDKVNHLTNVQLFKSSDNQLDAIISFSDSQFNGNTIRLKFINVNKLSICDLSADCYVDGLLLEDISDKGMENVNWELSDFEDDRISFHASSIELFEEI